MTLETAPKNAASSTGPTPAASACRMNSSSLFSLIAFDKDRSVTPLLS